MTKEITFESLCEDIPDRVRPFLDWEECYVEGALNSHDEEADPEFRATLKRQKAWRENGVLILENFFPHELLDAYAERYEKDNGKNAAQGYETGTPYMRVQEIKDLCLFEPLAKMLHEIIGEPMGLHLNLCNWVSTERTWHQDHYLNPDGVNCFYLAVWIPLADIHPDSGAFQYVAGSHRWPVMSGEKVMEALSLKTYNPDWPRLAETFVTRVFEEKIDETDSKVTTWNGRKGDVLIWHSLLAHRGSKPNNPDLRRKALIAHYSGIHHRADMRSAELYENPLTNSKGYFFPF